MNASLSDGNESVIDIFILSANSPLSTQLEKQLRDEGYYVTLFSDGTHLLETLRNGKPNLLICDTTVPDADAFEVCRQIKADDYLWNIPVLILTGAADLGDLLRVLDCNADNFIAHPFDSPYLLSLIEGMLTVPVERQTPEQIKTQFKIKHDDQVYVVTADRRKLLEFLLSSFEIAVNKSTDLYRAQEDSRNLGITIRKLEETVQENVKVIGIINETLKTKEQKLSELTGQLSNREQTIHEKIAAIDQLSRDLSSEKSAHTEVRSELERVIEERDASQAAYQSTIDQLQRQVSDMSSELAVLKPALERANEDLLKESSQRKETEDELITIATRKDQVEKALLALNTEYEQLKVNFGAEKNRASESEQELNAVMLAKTQSEQDLTVIINDLKATATQQAAVINRLREESESEHARLLQTEENLNTVTAAKEQSETSLRAAIDAGQKDLLDLQARLLQTEENLNTVTAAKEQSETSLRAAIDAGQKDLLDLQARLLQTEENLNTVTAAKEQSETSLRAAIDAGQKDLLDLQARLGTAQSLLEEKEQAIKTLTGDIAAAGSTRESAEQELASVTRVLAETNAALGGKKKDILELEARLNTARSQADEKEQAIKTLTGEITSVRSARESLEDELASATRALADANTALNGKQEDLAGLKARLDTAESLLEEKELAIKTLTDEISAARSARESLEQKLESVSSALAETNIAREAETRNVAAHKEDLARVCAEKEKAEALAGSLSGSLKEFRDQLEQEKFRFRDTEARMSGLIQQRDRELGELRRVHEETRTAFSSHKTSLDQMKQDLESALSKRTELEGKLQTAEEKIRRISQELESASEGREQEHQHLAALTDELERVKTNLEHETVRREESEDQIRDALSQQQQLEQDLERLVSENKTLHADLTAERGMLDNARKENRALEERVSSLSREKSEAEQAAANLTAEIDQARVALADEWEDHMTDNERLAVVAGKKPQTVPQPYSGVKKEAEIIKKRSLIVKVPTIPSDIHPLPRSIVAIDPVKISEAEIPHITSVEDLFEDDEDSGEKQSGEPVVSIVREPASEPVRDVLPDSIPSHSDDEESFFEDEASSVTDMGTIAREEETDAEDFMTDYNDAEHASGQDIALNRTQWLDLLRWSHHCDALEPDQRMQIVRMGRLIQKGRKLTRKQEEQVLEIIALVQKLGYRIP